MSESDRPSAPPASAPHEEKEHDQSRVDGERLSEGQDLPRKYQQAGLENYMPIEAELLPCPFCGEKAVLTNVRQSDHAFTIGCVNESCFRPRTSYYDTKEAVIALWNSRVEQ